jgi:ssRNA-specific RNase YbeY (16S rRNA maturation enzyme)
MATFSLSPSAIDDAVLDYSNKADIKKFEKAITKLNNTFHQKSEQMIIFKGDLELHASNNGWSNTLENSDIISIPTMVNANIRYNLIHEYSRLTTEDITVWANANIVGQQTHKAQNNANMHQCLYNSLSSSMLNKMLLESHRYTINDTPIAALYYKAIMGHSNVDTLATISFTCHMLSTLDVKMIDL